MPVRIWTVDRYMRDQHVLEVFPGTPPGVYLLIVRVYPCGQPERVLSVLNALGQPEGVEVKLARVTLRPSRWLSSVADLRAEHHREPVQGENPALVAYNQPQEAAQPGSQIQLVLFWSATDRLTQDLTARLAFLDGRDKEAAAIELPLVSTHPTSSWQRDDLWRGNHRVRIPRQLGSGSYRLVLSYAGQRVQLAELLNVVAPERRFTPPLEQNLGVSFEDAGALFAAELPDQLVLGEQVTVRLVWKATLETDRAYKVFVHLVDEQGAYVVGHDSEPANWQRPTTSWVVGEYVVDEHVLVPPKPGRYRLRVGLYDAETGMRLKTQTGEEFILLPTQLTVVSQ